MKSILLVEDENHIAEGIKFNLEKQGHRVEVASDGKLALHLFGAKKFDLVILDLMLPKLDGHQVLIKMRKNNEKIPVLVLSAKDSNREKVQAFYEGVDDYVTKPFNLDEFLARVEKLLIKASWYQNTNSRSINSETIYEFGDNKIDFSLLRASHGPKEIFLTQQELKILKVFLENPQIPLTRAQLLELAWGYSDHTNTRTLDNFIVRLRKYFEDDPKNPKYFLGIRNVGYVFYSKGKK